MKQVLAGLIFILLLIETSAQEKYWVSFTDKSGVSFDPLSYFDKRTIDHRTKHNIPLNDSTDYPVNSEYLRRVSDAVDSISYPSRWLNGVAIYANRSKAYEISRLPFVESVFEMSNRNLGPLFRNEKTPRVHEKEVPLLRYQLQRMQGDLFKSNKLDGQGIRIAVFDVGFPNVDNHPAFNHLRNGKQIIATYDFVSKKENVYHGHWHGTATLSCIAGKTDSLNIGLATGAEFLLARTEKLFWETFSEEENWLAAAEWADKNGANIISSSLGYTFHRYFNDQMDGRISLVSRAATMAASKGILVVNAAGNEGSNSWHNIAAPADADSVLTVGGTNPHTDLQIYFSSFGPTSTGKLKPNVCATGEAIVATSGGYGEKAGTSFSAPLVAGFAACAWQSHRQWTNMELFNEIEKSSNLYPYYDYAHGFGIPQAKYFTSLPEEKPATFDIVVINNDIKVFLREEYAHPADEAYLGFSSRRNFYYKIEDKEGHIKKYTVLLADRKEMLHFLVEEFQPGDVIFIHFEGYTSSFDFPDVLK